MQSIRELIKMIGVENGGELMNNPQVIVVDPDEYPQKALIFDEKHVAKGLISGDVVQIKEEKYSPIEDEKELSKAVGVYAGKLEIVEEDKIITI
jgi:hypothetical protein